MAPDTKNQLASKLGHSRAVADDSEAMSRDSQSAEIQSRLAQAQCLCQWQAHWGKDMGLDYPMPIAHAIRKAWGLGRLPGEYLRPPERRFIRVVKALALEYQQTASKT